MLVAFPVSLTASRHKPQTCYDPPRGKKVPSSSNHECSLRNAHPPMKSCLSQVSASRCTRMRMLRGCHASVLPPVLPEWSGRSGTADTACIPLH